MWIQLLSLAVAVAQLAGAELTLAQPVPATPASQIMREGMGTWTFSHKGDADNLHHGRYLEYTPAGWNGTTPLPLLIFLHGAGARTELNDSIDALYAEFFPTLIRQGKRIDAIVLCPQVASYWGNQGVEFLDQAMVAYAGRFDADRIYLTGLSSGGGGTWAAALERHHLLAAAVPICGIRKSADRDAALVNLPIWAFHNIHDPYQSVEYTRAHVTAIRAAGGRWLRSTEYDETPGKSHPDKQGKIIWPACHAQAWEAAYTDEALWTWLFRQRRGKPELALDE